MVVNNTAQPQLTESRNAGFTLVAQSVSILAPDGTVYTPIVTVISGIGTPVQVLQCDFMPLVGGNYILTWTLNDGASILQRTTYAWAYWTDAQTYIRQKLSANSKNLPDIQIDREFWLIDLYLHGEFSVLAPYADLTGNDQIFYDAAVALFDALRLLGYKRRLAPTGEIIEWKVQQNDFKFQPTMKPVQYSLFAVWEDEANQMLGQVSMLKALYAGRKAAIHLFTVFGPTRKSIDSGRQQTLFGITARLLTDDIDLNGGYPLIDGYVLPVP